jgi:hypothetical protein
VKLKVTVARSLSENEKVVPVGVFAPLMLASRFPSRHLLVDWRAFRTAGGRDVSLGADGEVDVSWAGGVVIVAVVEVAPRISVVNV